LAERLKLTWDVTVPIHKRSSEPKDSLQRIAEHSARQNLGQSDDQIVLIDGAVLIFIDIDTPI
jgi:hypothetical protein